jgi:hypothetical protein
VMTELPMISNGLKRLKRLQTTRNIHSPAPFLRGIQRNGGVCIPALEMVGKNCIGSSKYCLAPVHLEVLFLRRHREHIYRVHRQPLYCLRCFQTFISEIEMEKHVRNDSESMCKVVEPPLIVPEGFNNAQEKKLRARTEAQKTDLEKWKDIWMILFPNDSEYDIKDPRKLKIISSENKVSHKFRRILLETIRGPLTVSAWKIEDIGSSTTQIHHGRGYSGRNQGNHTRRRPGTYLAK